MASTGSALASPATEAGSKSGTQEGPAPQMKKGTNELAVQLGQVTSLLGADTLTGFPRSLPALTMQNLNSTVSSDLAGSWSALC